MRQASDLSINHITWSKRRSARSCDLMRICATCSSLSRQVAELLSARHWRSRTRLVTSRSFRHVLLVKRCEPVDRRKGSLDLRMVWIASTPNGRGIRHVADVIFCWERSPIIEVATMGLYAGRDVAQSQGISIGGTLSSMVQSGGVDCSSFSKRCKTVSLT